MIVNSLNEALKLAETSAHQAYRVVKRSTSLIDELVERSLLDIQRKIDELSSNSLRNDQTSILIGQKKELERKFRALQQTLQNNLRNRQQNSSRFNIVVFGRTMVGKSTLMEILINGDGSRIGKGAQRTTRDVRTYSWRNLNVTDVPGVAAFEEDGRKDEQLAYQKAKESDLVLFLISDDAPQSEEAKHFCQIRKLGKPVILILNVKHSLHNKLKRKQFFRKQEQLFNKKRIGEFLSQFQELIRQKCSNNFEILAFPTHLHARFLAGQNSTRTNQFKPRDTPIKRADQNLMQASRFETVEREIILKIKQNAPFMRYRTLLEEAIVLLQDFQDEMKKTKQKTRQSVDVSASQTEELNIWKRKFTRQTEDKIRYFISRYIGGLEREIPAFADHNYENQNSENAWGQIVQRLDISRKVENFQKEIIRECQRELTAITREFQVEANANFSSSKASFYTPEIIDTKFGVMVFGTAGALLLGSSFIPIWGAAMWIGIGVLSLGNLLFESKAEKIEKQRRNLRKNLENWLTSHGENLRKSLNNWLEQLDSTLLTPICYEYGKQTKQLGSLFRFQETTIQEIEKQLQNLQEKLYIRLIRHILSDEMEQYNWIPRSSNQIMSIQRRSGYGLTIKTYDSRWARRSQIRNIVKQISEMLGEPVQIVDKYDNRLWITFL